MEKYSWEMWFEIKEKPSFVTKIFFFSLIIRTDFHFYPNICLSFVVLSIFPCFLAFPDFLCIVSLWLVADAWCEHLYFVGLWMLPLAEFWTPVVTTKVEDTMQSHNITDLPVANMDTISVPSSPCNSKCDKMMARDQVKKTQTASFTIFQVIFSLGTCNFICS